MIEKSSLNPYGYELILASGSPRRHQYLTDLGLPFRIEKKEVEETFPQSLEGAAIAEHITTSKKLLPFGIPFERNNWLLQPIL